MLVTEVKIFQGAVGTVVQVFDGSQLVAGYQLKGSVVTPLSVEIPNVPPVPKPEPTEYYLRLVRKNLKDSFGNEILALSVCPAGTSTPLATVHCVSGQANRQNFKIGGTGEKPGSMEPLPQGNYRLGIVEFKSANDWNSSWGDGLGPVWVAIDPKFRTERSAFGIHLDDGAHGTAGCVGLVDLNSLKTVVEWFNKYSLSGKELTVDWGLSAPQQMVASSACENLIKKWEGCHLTAYLCPANVWTIGRGSIYHYDLKRPVQEGDVIEQWKADQYLWREVAEKTKGVLEALGGVTVTQNQLDAFVSFAYNCGVEAFKNSTLLRKFKAGDIQGAADEFDRWIHGDNEEVLPGLVSRRKDEKELFLS